MTAAIRRPLDNHPKIKVYFDSGVTSERPGKPAAAWVGFAIYVEEAQSPADYLTISRAESGLGGAVGYWHPNGRRFLEEVGETVAQYPFVRGSQLYDLVAAHGAVLHLRVNEYRGEVRLIGDGREVIEYLNGRDDALHLEIAGQDLARVVRRQIRDETNQLAKFSWGWVSTRHNWADRVARKFGRGDRAVHRGTRGNVPDAVLNL